MAICGSVRAPTWGSSWVLVAALLTLSSLVFGFGEGTAHAQQACGVQDPDSSDAVQEFDPAAARLKPGTPDQVVTTDGSRLLGELKELQNAQLKFNTDASDDIYLRWEMVLTLTTSRSFEVVLASGTRLYGTIVGSEDGRLFVGDGDRFTEVQRTSIVEITRIRQGFFQRLKGNVDVGFGASQAGTQRDLTANLGARYRTPKTNWKLTGSTYVRRQEGAEDVNRGSLLLAHYRYLSGRWFVTLGGQIERNDEYELESRITVAGGAGYHLVRTARQDLLVWLGVAPNREAFLDDTPTQSNVDGVVGVSYSYYRLGSTDTGIEIDTAFFPSFTTSGRYRLAANLALRHEVTSDLYVTLNVYGTGDTDPPSTGAPKSDSSLSLGIGYSW